IDGVNLREYCADGRSAGAALSKGEALRIIRLIASALDAAHKVGIVHFDIKPENIMLGKNIYGKDVVKVLDFGVARLRKSITTSRPEYSPSPGYQMGGTPAYMAP